MVSCVAFTMLGSGWRFQGNLVGTRSTDPHTLNWKNHDICSVLAGVAPFHINDIGAAPGLVSARRNMQGTYGRPWSYFSSCILHRGGPPTRD